MIRIRRPTIPLGIGQLVSWGTSFYLPAIIAGPAARDLEASPVTILGAFTLALLAAGAAAPLIGRRIDRAGGRGVLAAGAIVLALGLGAMAAAQNLVHWYLAWSLLGLGMALSLYDSAFATVARLPGVIASQAITGITLFGGFASTLFWPLGAALEATWGWRATLVAYAVLQLALNLPIALALPAPVPPTPAAPAQQGASSGTGRAWTLGCLAGFFGLRWFVTSALAAAILPLFGGLGLDPRQAVLAAALIGPGQVLGRLLEWRFGRRFDLMGRARAGAALMPLAILLLLADGFPTACGFALLYGISNGIMTINRGTLPLALFGPAGYAARLGWLAVPVLLGQAVAPPLTAPLVAHWPAHAVFLAAGGVGLAAILLLCLIRRPHVSLPCQ